MRFANGLQLVEVRERCTDCAHWRRIDFHSNASPAPVRQERVIVQDGVTAMYAFPGTQYFANTKVERSVGGKYEYASCTQNALGLMGATISQVQVFVPREATIVTAYLLVQEKAAFHTIEAFLRLRREFIEGYIDFLPAE